MKKIRVFILILVLLMIGNYKVNADTFAGSIECPEQITKGETFECSVKVNVTPESPVVGISGSIIKNDNFLFDHFEKTEGITVVKEAYNNGFEYTSVDGVPNGETIFKVYLRVDGKSKTSNQKIKMSLTNVKFKDGNYVSNSEIESNDIKFLNNSDPKSSENRLSSIKFSNGNLSPNFDSDLLEYTLITDQEELTITPTAKDSLATIQINGGTNNKIKLVPGENKVTVKVIAEDKWEKEYKITVVCNDNRNDDASLQLLSVDGRKVFLKNEKYDYEIDVPYETEKANLLYAASSSTSTVEIEGSETLLPGKNDIVLVVTSEKGTTQKYNLTINRLEEVKSGNSSIKKIEILNVDDLDFDFKSDNHNYMIKLPNDVDKLNFNIELTDSKASYEITGNENLKDYSKVLIKVTAEDESTTTYTFLIEKNESNNLMLVIIIVIIVLLVVAVIVFIIIKNNKKKNNKNDKNDNNINSSNDNSNVENNVVEESNNSEIVDESIEALNEEPKEEVEESDDSEIVDEFIRALNEEPTGKFDLDDDEDTKEFVIKRPLEVSNPIFDDDDEVEEDY